VSPATSKPSEGRRRVQVDAIRPHVDRGRFPVKGVVGDSFRVEADVFGDSHDRIRVQLLYRRKGTRRWSETPMVPQGNDLWEASFLLEEPGAYQYTVEGWVDALLTWRTELAKWIDAGVEVELELREGALLLEAAAERAKENDDDAEALRLWARQLREWADDPSGRGAPSELAVAPGLLEGELPRLMETYPDRSRTTRPRRTLTVEVDRKRARFSAWYEFFPRSTSPEPGRHGTFADASAMLPYIREMGFDVVYLPPIHPIGKTKRKGPNNRVTSGPGDPGSPWAIGSAEGGHTAIHPELGTLDDFVAFRRRAEELGMEVALDVAFQCSPDHPWVAEHPEWFRQRPDGSIRHAENPPKKYEDIYPLDFETEDWEGLWDALRDVFLHWMEQGVRIFRVDNPHTKAFPFWEWLVSELRDRDPGVILLSEAFTRPKVMYRLAKVGYAQSYTYFAWRTEKEELVRYMEELNRPGVREHFRPNFWPNTPDILTEFLQTGGRPAFMLRLVLAATLTANYGIYGPAFELMEHTPREPGSEEYLNSEKYQLRTWPLDREDSLRHFIARVNRIRREQPALQRNDTLHFHPVDNDQIVVYSKSDPGGDDPLVMIVSLDPRHTQSGWVDLHHLPLGLDGESYELEDLLGGERYDWGPGANFVRLAPHNSPAHIFRLRPHDSGSSSGGSS